jgi:hypothetical protein
MPHIEAQTLHVHEQVELSTEQELCTKYAYKGMSLSYHINSTFIWLYPVNLWLYYKLISARPNKLPYT